MTWQKNRRFGGGKGSAWDMYGPIFGMMASGGRWGSDWGSGFGSDYGSDWDDSDGMGSSGRGGPGRAKRRGRMFASGELRLALLALIARTPSHGYELIKGIEEMTGGTYAPSPGAVYPTLQLLADEGRIEEAEAEGAKKPFQATSEGRAELEERKAEVEALMERLGEHGSRAQKARSPDLFRAMANLATVLRNRARKGDLDKASLDEIVDIIDEVAKRIERL